MKAKEVEGLSKLALVLMLVLSSGWFFDGLFGALTSLLIFLLTVYLASGFIFHVHDMPRRRDAVQAMFTYIFGLHFPIIEVAEGRVSEKSRGTPGAKLGGPGIIKVAEDTAAVLVRGKEAQVISRSTYVARKGEKVKDAVDLRPQTRNGSVKAMTRDGFEVEVDFAVGFQIATGRREPTAEEPYPFAEQAVLRAVYRSKQVGEDGAQTWHERIPGFVYGNVQEMIATHKLDDLFGPDDSKNSPRSDLMDELKRETQKLADNIGVQISWVGFGTPRIPDEATRRYIELYGARIQQHTLRTLVQVFNKLPADAKVDQLVRVRFIEALEAIARDKTSTLVLPYDAIEALRPSLSGRGDTRSLAAPSAEGQS
jgi:regulator of protease activity HflC (stomatin/prohibitin superfamily)